MLDKFKAFSFPAAKRQKLAKTCRCNIFFSRRSIPGHLSVSWVTPEPPKIGAAKVSLKAALRETGHCDRYKHHLEKKVPHHPNEEELISSLSFGLLGLSKCFHEIPWINEMTTWVPHSFIIQHLLIGVTSPLKEKWVNRLPRFKGMALFSSKILGFANPYPCLDGMGRLRLLHSKPGWICIPSPTQPFFFIEVINVLPSLSLTVRS